LPDSARFPRMNTDMVTPFRKVKQNNLINIFYARVHSSGFSIHFHTENIADFLNNDHLFTTTTISSLGTHTLTLYLTHTLSHTLFRIMQDKINTRSSSVPEKMQIEKYLPSKLRWFLPRFNLIEDKSIWEHIKTLFLLLRAAKYFHIRSFMTTGCAKGKFTDIWKRIRNLACFWATLSKFI